MEKDGINPWCKNADGSLCQTMGVPYACEGDCLRKQNYLAAQREFDLLKQQK